MINTLAFDVYGTLIDTQGVTQTLITFFGGDSAKAQSFSLAWRDKQLEYSFRRGLMKSYQTFAICTRDALDYTCDFLQAPLSAEQKQQLLDVYKTLPAFAEAEEALAQLKETGLSLYAFSNGTKEAVENLLSAAGIESFFEGIVSVDDIQTFKPDPKVYQHFLSRAKAKAETTCLVSGNPFDVIGARQQGWQSAWVKRSDKACFDPWGVSPSYEIANLMELKKILI